jgi:hypothetical protein
MENPYHAGGLRLRDECAGVVLRLPGMNDYRPLHLRREIQLSAKRGALKLAW